MSPKLTAALIVGGLITLVAVLDWRDRQRSTANRDQPEPVPRPQQYPTEEQHRSTEQRFWRRQTGLGVGALLLTFGAVVAAAFTWRATQGQLQELRSEQRPWVYA